MPIKLRILLCLLGLQVIGFGLLIGYQAHEAERALGVLRNEQIGEAFNGSVSRIDALAGQIERSVIDMAAGGEAIHAARADLSAAAREALLRDYLIRHFERFGDALGGGLWYEPNTLDPAARRYGPYAFRRDDGRVVFTWDLNTTEYDYHTQSWYETGLPADWPRDRRRDEPVYWTEPYYDEAGSMALMVSAVAPMYDHDGRLLGVATADWSLEAMRSFVAGIRITPGSRPFLIEPWGGRMLSATLEPELVMQPASRREWTAHALAQARPDALGELKSLRIGEVDYRMYFMATRIGLVFGVLIPQADIDAALQAIAGRTISTAIAVSIGFLLVMAIALMLSFRPFNRLLRLIVDSIDHDPQGRLQLHALDYPSRNEFAPIVAALNHVYANVQAYTRQLSDAYAQLQRQGSEIEALNTSLEQKVAARTRELADRNDELQHSLADLRQTQQQLIEAEKHAMLNKLVAGIAHEVNTPLGVACTASSYLSDRTAGFRTLLAGADLRRSDLERYIDTCSESLSIIEFNLDRAAALVRGFKQVSVDQSSEARRSFELGSYVADIVLSLRPQLKRTAVAVDIDCPEPVTIDSYPGALSQVLANLIMNSLAHGFDDGASGRITITIRQAADGVVVGYADNGCGIDADYLGRIFDPFFTTRRERGGSGLGMHIVRELVTRRMGGTIGCRSAPGEGVQFDIGLPVRAPLADPVTVDPAVERADDPAATEADRTVP